MPNTTFIIPVKIDSEKRLENVQITLSYLLKHTDGNIIITEADDVQKLFLNPNSRIKYYFEQSKPTEFHRTRLINQMLNEVDTEITSNYDADILLPPDAYKIAEHLISTENCDLVYPYGFEQFDQVRVHKQNYNIDIFKKSLDLKDLPKEILLPGFCRYGHVQFFKTKSYISGYMENENYKHWCPEDEERGIRFQKLGYKVVWFRSPVFHQEHPASTLSPPLNKDEIDSLHAKLITFDKDEVIAYYNQQDYLKKYIRKKCDNN